MLPPGCPNLEKSLVSRCPEQSFQQVRRVPSWCCGALGEQKGVVTEGMDPAQGEDPDRVGA